MYSYVDPHTTISQMAEATLSEGERAASHRPLLNVGRTSHLSPDQERLGEKSRGKSKKKNKAITRGRTHQMIVCSVS